MNPFSRKHRFRTEDTSGTETASVASKLSSSFNLSNFSGFLKSRWHSESKPRDLNDSPLKPKLQPRKKVVKRVRFEEVAFWHVYPSDNLFGVNPETLNSLDLYIALEYPFSLEYLTISSLKSADRKSATKIWKEMDQNPIYCNFKVTNQHTKLVEGSNLIKIVEPFYDMGNIELKSTYLVTEESVKIFINSIQRVIAYIFDEKIGVEGKDEEFDDGSLMDRDLDIYALGNAGEELLENMFDRLSESEEAYFDELSMVGDFGLKELFPKFLQLGKIAEAAEDLDLNFRTSINMLVTLLVRMLSKKDFSGGDPVLYCQATISKAFESVFDRAIRIYSSTSFSSVKGITGLPQSKSVLEVFPYFVQVEDGCIDFFSRTMLEPGYANGMRPEDQLQLPECLLKLNANKFFVWPQREWLQLQLRLADLYLGTLQSAISYAMLNNSPPLVEALCRIYENTPKCFSNCARLYKSYKSEYNLYPVDRAINTSAHRFKASKKRGAKVVVNSLIPGLHPLVAADLAFSERDMNAKCSTNCVGHQGRLLLLLVSLGHEEMVKLLAPKLPTVDLKVCFGQEMIYKLYWTGGRQDEENKRWFVKARQPFNSYSKLPQIRGTLNDVDEEIEDLNEPTGEFQGFCDQVHSIQECARELPTILGIAVRRVQNGEAHRMNICRYILEKSELEYSDYFAIKQTLWVTKSKNKSVRALAQEILRKSVNDGEDSLSFLELEEKLIFEALMKENYSVLSSLISTGENGINDHTKSNQILFSLLDNPPDMPKWRIAKAVIRLILQHGARIDSAHVKIFCSNLYEISKVNYVSPPTLSEALGELLQHETMMKLLLPRIPKNARTSSVRTTLSKAEKVQLFETLVSFELNDMVHEILSHQKLDFPVIASLLKLAAQRCNYDTIFILLRVLLKKYRTSPKLNQMMEEWIHELLVIGCFPSLLEETTGDYEVQLAIYDRSTIGIINGVCELIETDGVLVKTSENGEAANIGVKLEDVIKPSLAGDCLIPLLKYGPFGSETQYVASMNQDVVLDFCQVTLFETLNSLFFHGENFKSVQKEPFISYAKSLTSQSTQRIRLHEQDAFDTLRSKKARSSPHRLTLDDKLSEKTDGSAPAQGASNKQSKLNTKDTCGLLQLLLEDDESASLWPEGVNCFISSVERCLRSKDAKNGQVKEVLRLVTKLKRSAVMEGMEEFEIIIKGPFITRRLKNEPKHMHNLANLKSGYSAQSESDPFLFSIDDDDEGFIEYEDEVPGY